MAAETHCMAGFRPVAADLCRERDAIRAFCAQKPSSWQRAIGKHAGIAQLRPKTCKAAETHCMVGFHPVCAGFSAKRVVIRAFCAPKKPLSMAAASDTKICWRCTGAPKTLHDAETHFMAASEPIGADLSAERDIISAFCAPNMSCSVVGCRVTLRPFLSLASLWSQSRSRENCKRSHTGSKQKSQAKTDGGGLEATM
jgi:hypothetical protein